MYLYVSLPVHWSDCTVKCVSSNWYFCELGVRTGGCMGYIGGQCPLQHLGQQKSSGMCCDWVHATHQQQHPYYIQTHVYKHQSAPLVHLYMYTYI